MAIANKLLTGTKHKHPIHLAFKFEHLQWSGGCGRDQVTLTFIYLQMIANAPFIKLLKKEVWRGILHSWMTFSSDGVKYTPHNLQDNLFTPSRAWRRGMVVLTNWSTLGHLIYILYICRNAGWTLGLLHAYYSRLSLYAYFGNPQTSKSYDSRCMLSTHLSSALRAT